VSVQTVYDSVGSKADLVRRLNDLVDAEAGVGPLAAAVGDDSDPVSLVGTSARITRQILQRCGDIVRGGMDAARTEPDLADVVEEGARRHRAGARFVAERLAAIGALDPSIRAADAAVTIAALSDLRIAMLLVDDHGLDLDAAEAWMTATTARAVLPAPAGPAAAPLGSTE
jgi:hypothetical protein